MLDELQKRSYGAHSKDLHDVLWAVTINTDEGYTTLMVTVDCFDRYARVRMSLEESNLYQEEDLAGNLPSART